MEGSRHSFSAYRGPRHAVTRSRSDEQVQSAVRDALAFDPRLESAADRIEVSVEDGVATLSGKLDSLEAKLAARRDAQNVLGVRRVKNHIKVRLDELPADEQVVQGVHQAFHRDPYLHRFDFDVRARNNRLFLYGDVDTRFEKRHAEDVASRVRGVVDIDNLLRVRGQPTPKSDGELADDIEQQLAWNARLGAGEVNVSVQDGVALLTGTVDTYHQRQAARHSARLAGASRVVNRVKVRQRQP